MTTPNNTSAKLQSDASVDFVQMAIDNQREVQKNKDWKLSEKAKIEKEMNKELDLIDNAYKASTQSITDELARASIKLGFDAKKLEVRAKYQPKIDELKLDMEVAGEAIGVVVGEKVGATIAPVVKSGVATVNTFLDRSGLSGLFRRK